MKKWIYNVIIILLTVGATLGGVKLYNKNQEAKEFNKYYDYLDKEYFVAIKDSSDIFQDAAKANEEVELDGYYTSKLVSIEKLKEKLDTIEKKLIDKELGYRDPLSLKKQNLRIINNAHHALEMISIYANASTWDEDDPSPDEVAGYFDEYFSEVLKDLNDNLDKQNALLEKYID